jgi:hypothetical protein
MNSVAIMQAGWEPQLRYFSRRHRCVTIEKVR